MKHLIPYMAMLASLSLASTVVPASADPLKNIVLVHGAWVDASGWQSVYDILTKRASMSPWCRSPKPRLPTTLPQRSGFSTFRTAPRSSSGTAMAARSSRKPGFIPTSWVWSTSPPTRPMSGKTRPSSARRCRASWQDRRRDQDRRRTNSPISTRRIFPSFSRPICRASRRNSWRARRCWPRPAVFSDAADRGRVEDEAELGNRRRERSDHQPRSRALVLRAGQEPHDRNRRRKPLRLRIPPEQRSRLVIAEAARNAQDAEGAQK